VPATAGAAVTTGPLFVFNPFPFQLYEFAPEAERITGTPKHILPLPGVADRVTAGELIVICWLLLDCPHAFVAETVNIPEVLTVMLFPVAPVLQLYVQPEQPGELAVRVTVCGPHTEFAGVAVITGTGGCSRPIVTGSVRIARLLFSSNSWTPVAPSTTKNK
jgi:hypothetical protein